MAGIRRATTADAPRMAELAEQKREQYEHYAPVFHRPKQGVRDEHAEFLASLIGNAERYVALVHGVDDGHVDG